MANGQTIWISTCGQYYAIKAPVLQPAYDIVERAGEERVWLAHRYHPTSCADPDPRYRYAEFPRGIASWSNFGHTLRSGRYIPAFDVGFMDIRQDVLRERLTCQSVLASYRAEFRRRQRVSHQTWDRLQFRIMAAIIAGHESLLAALSLRAESAVGDARGVERNDYRRNDVCLEGHPSR